MCGPIAATSSARASLRRSCVDARRRPRPRASPRQPACTASDEVAAARRRSRIGTQSAVTTPIGTPGSREQHGVGLGRLWLRQARASTTRAAVHLARPQQPRRRRRVRARRSRARRRARSSSGVLQHALPLASRRASSSSAARSAGSGASKRSRAPLRGCVKPSSSACSAGRVERALERRASAAPVDGIAGDRQPDRREVHADLVGAAGARTHLEQAALALREAPRTRHSLVAARPTRRAHAHALAVARVAADRQIDATADPRPARRARAPGRRARRCARWNWSERRAVRRVALRDHEHARGAAVEAVHDARAQHVADAGEIVAVVQQRVHERAARVPRRRVHDDARPACRARSGPRPRRARRAGSPRAPRGRRLRVRRNRLDQVARAHALARLHRAVVDAHAPELDPAARLRARASASAASARSRRAPASASPTRKFKAGSVAVQPRAGALGRRQGSCWLPTPWCGKACSASAARRARAESGVARRARACACSSARRSGACSPRDAIRIEAEAARVALDEAAHVDGRGQIVEALLLDEAQVGRVHLGDARDLVELDAARAAYAPQARAVVLGALSSGVRRPRGLGQRGGRRQHGRACRSPQRPAQAPPPPTPARAAVGAARLRARVVGARAPRCRRASR